MLGYTSSQSSSIDILSRVSAERLSKPGSGRRIVFVVNIVCINAFAVVSSPLLKNPAVY